MADRQLAIQHRKINRKAICRISIGAIFIEDKNFSHDVVKFGKKTDTWIRNFEIIELQKVKQIEKLIGFIVIRETKFAKNAIRHGKFLQAKLLARFPKEHAFP